MRHISVILHMNESKEHVSPPNGSNNWTLPSFSPIEIISSWKAYGPRKKHYLNTPAKVTLVSTSSYLRGLPMLL
jgi:hypothetical protein